MNNSSQPVYYHPDTAPQELEERITLEGLEVILRGAPKTAHKLVLIPLIVIMVMWEQAGHGILIGWGLLVLISIYIRYGIAISFIRSNVQVREVRKWGNRLALSALFSAMVWSSAVFLFYTEGSVEHQVFMFTLVISLCVGSVMLGAYWLPAFYLFSAPIMGALVIRLVVEGTLAYAALAILVLWYFLASIELSKALNKSLRSEMRLRHEGTELVAALNQKAEEAQTATLAKSRFLAAASHDLRQPLHALSLFIDVLKESRSDNERSTIFPRIELSLDALRKLFDSLLDVSRLDAKVVKPEIGHFDLPELLGELAEEFKAVASQKHLSLKVHAQPSVVISDRLLLERILRNLISNAIRYTETGGVLLSCRPRGDEILLQVWDTGIGISDKDREEVFVEFHQLHNAHRDRAEGLGLGLALVRRMCRLLNHELRLDSRLGKGSVFSIYLSRGNESLLDNRKAVARLHSWDLNGRAILVIDDEKDILSAMSTLLSKWGCEVITAESQDDAITELKKRKLTPDIILSDLRLRDMKTGVEAINAVREYSDVPIPGIVITGDTAPDQIRLVKDSGYELLQKPVQPARLRSVIHHHLSGMDKKDSVHLL